MRLHAQETKSWCWAASTQMVLEYYRISVGQSMLANQLFKRQDCGTRPVPAPCDNGGHVMFADYGIDCDCRTAALTPEEIAYQIAVRENPLTCGWAWPGGGGHVLVLGGYKRLKDGTFMVEIFDPAPAIQTDKPGSSGGGHYFLTYDRWVADHDHNLKDVLFNFRPKR